MVGRGISRWDEDILRDLKSFWHDKVKIDFDIISEPCIFFQYNNSSFEIVYKLSANGKYVRNRWHYVKRAHDAILSCCEQKYIDGHNTENDKKNRENFLKHRDKIKKHGFKDDLPLEGE